MLPASTSAPGVDAAFANGNDALVLVFLLKSMIAPNHLPLHLTAVAIALSALATPALSQQQPQTPPTNNGEATTDGWRGYLAINYKGGRFVMPYSRIVSVSRHEFIVDGGGKVYELTIDTTGSVIARFYYLETTLANVPLSSAKILNNRLEDLTKRAEQRTGQDARSVVKHYPDTTHARTVEFNVANQSHLDRIYDHIIREWIEENGRGAPRTLRFD